MASDHNANIRRYVIVADQRVGRSHLDDAKCKTHLFFVVLGGFGRDDGHGPLVGGGYPRAAG